MAPNQKFRRLSFPPARAQHSPVLSVSGFWVDIFVTLINEEGRQNNWSTSINCFELQRRLREGITIYLCNFVTGHRNFLSPEPGLSWPVDGPRALIIPPGPGAGHPVMSCENNEQIEKIIFYAHTELVNKRFPVWVTLWSRQTSTRCGIIILFSVCDSQRFVRSLHNIIISESPSRPHLASSPNARQVWWPIFCFLELLNWTSSLKFVYFVRLGPIRKQFTINIQQGAFQSFSPYLCILTAEAWPRKSKSMF